MNERAWMVHSTMLLRERVEKFNPEAEMVADPETLLMLLKWQLAWQSRVLKCVQAGKVERLSPVGRVWWGYMRDKAALQVARYANEISEEVFRIKSGHLRKMRDCDLRMMSKGRVA